MGSLVVEQTAQQMLFWLRERSVRRRDSRLAHRGGEGIGMGPLAIPRRRTHVCSNNLRASALRCYLATPLFFGTRRLAKTSYQGDT